MLSLKTLFVALVLLPPLMFFPGCVKEEKPLFCPDGRRVTDLNQCFIPRAPTGFEKVASDLYFMNYSFDLCMNNLVGNLSYYDGHFSPSKLFTLPMITEPVILSMKNKTDKVHRNFEQCERLVTEFKKIKSTMEIPQNLTELETQIEKKATTINLWKPHLTECLNHMHEYNRFWTLTRERILKNEKLKLNVFFINQWIASGYLDNALEKVNESKKLTEELVYIETERNNLGIAPNSKLVEMWVGYHQSFESLEGYILSLKSGDEDLAKESYEKYKNTYSNASSLISKEDLANVVHQVDNWYLQNVRMHIYSIDASRS